VPREASGVLSSTLSTTEKGWATCGTTEVGPCALIPGTSNLVPRARREGLPLTVLSPGSPGGGCAGGWQ